MQLAFKKADTDGNGRLDSAEIHNALRESGFNINFNGSTPFQTSNTRSHNNLLTTPFSKKIACNCLHRKYNKTGQGLDMAEWIALVGVLSPLSLLSSSLTNNCCFSQVAHISLARSLFERRDLNKCGVITLKIDELMQISAVL